MAKMRKDERPYQIRKVGEMFRLFDTKTMKPLANYGDQDFKTPAEAARFIKGILKIADDAAKEAAQQAEEEAAKKIAAIAEKSIPPVAETKGFEIPIIEGQAPVIIVGDNEKYFEVTIREHGEPGRPSEPMSDGFNTTYHVAMGKKVILPEPVINTAKEAVYTVMATSKDENQKLTHTKIETPRFSVEVGRQVPAEEAKKWLEDQRKYNIACFK